MATRIIQETLKVVPVQAISIFHGAEIVSVRTKGNIPYLVALVDDTQPCFQRIIEMIDIGSEVGTEKRRYVSTIEINGGLSVLHVFERL